MFRSALLSMLLVSASAQAAIVVDTDALVRFNPAAQGIVLRTFGLPAPRPGTQPLRTTLVQTFTAGTAGRLHGIDLQLFQFPNSGGGTIGLTLIQGDFAAGANLIWGQQDFALENLRTTSTGRDLEPLLRFDTAAFGLNLAVGDRFSVLFDVIPSNEFAAASALIGNSLGLVEVPGVGFRPILEGSNYAGGSLYNFSNGRLSTPSVNDVGFRTFINTGPAAIPEPQSWAMMVIGFALAGTALRRRHAVAG